MTRRGRRTASLWALAALAALAPTVVAAFVVLDVQRGPRPPAPAPTDVPSDGRRACAAGGLQLAGSGSNLALTRALVAAWQSRDPDAGPATVHDSIGSTGGVRAVRDGAVDIGLVSRPVPPEERGAALVVRPHARVPVAVVANPGVPDEPLREGDLLALYAGHRAAWSDGQPVVVLQRESGDSSHRAVERALPGFAAVNEAAWRSGRWRVLYSDRTMRAALLDTPGAVGLLDLGTIVAHELPLRVLSVDGVRPDAEAVARGAWPWFKDLAFVTSSAPCPTARRFLDFVASPAGRRVTRSLGYVPLPVAERHRGADEGGR